MHPMRAVRGAAASTSGALGYSVHRAAQGHQGDQSRNRSRYPPDGDPMIGMKITPRSPFSLDCSLAPCQKRDASRCLDCCQPGFKRDSCNVTAVLGRGSRWVSNTKYWWLDRHLEGEGLILTKMGSKHLEWVDDVRSGRLAQTSRVHSSYETPIPRLTANWMGEKGKRKDIFAELHLCYSHG